MCALYTLQRQKNNPNKGNISYFVKRTLALKLYAKRLGNPSLNTLVRHSHGSEKLSSTGTLLLIFLIDLCYCQGDPY